MEEVIVLMAKRRSIVRYVGRKRRSFRRPKTLSLAIAAGFMVPIVPAVKRLIQGDGLMGFKDEMQSRFIGLSPEGKFESNRLMGGLYPVALGFGVHWFASKIGINRALGRAGIPFVRI